MQAPLLLPEKGTVRDHLRVIWGLLGPIRPYEGDQAPLCTHWEQLKNRLLEGREGSGISELP